MAHKQLPGWFPFALLASGLIAIGAGIKSNWGRPATLAKTTPPGAPVQGGVLQDFWGGLRGIPGLSRWFFWYVLPPEATAYGARGPEYMTDQAAFQLEFETKTATLGTKLYRFVWIPEKGIWVYDTRNDPELLASSTIRDARGNVVG
jgi:hypothetical protein